MRQVNKNIRRFMLALLLLGTWFQGPLAASRPPIDAFLKFDGIYDIALSPSGTWIAAVRYSGNDEHVRILTVHRVHGTDLTLHEAAKFEYTRVYDLAWANDERLLVTLQKYDPETGSALTVSPGLRHVTWRPVQILSLDPKLQNGIALLKDEKDFKFTVDKSEILHWLPSEPRHVLMEIYDSRGQKGLNVYKVNVYDGKAELIEEGRYYTKGWMVDSNAKVRLRIDRRHGSTTYLARNSAKEEWFEVARFRRREIPDILPLAFSADRDVLYVLAPRAEDRQAVFEYDMKARTLGRMVFAHTKVDVTGALITRPDNRLAGFRYVVHKPAAHYLDDALLQFDRKLNRTFGAENFARPISVTRDRGLMVIKVTGPCEPGSFYLYEAATNRAKLIGVRSRSLNPSQLGVMVPLVYKARDGVEINAYFTSPPGNPQRPPLVVMPHGGPEARDYMEWNTQVQFLASRGYAVLQPNFRGSDGFGKNFAESGYKQWGLKMQDDITDGVRHVVAQGLADPRRICIVGGSYGGYAALAGAAFTPRLYRCAASINGIGDLFDFVRWKRGRGAYDYWTRSIGDPFSSDDRTRMKARSPVRSVDRIAAPVLLIAGTDDRTVPVSQSGEMAKALEKAGKPYEYIKFKDEGHSIDAYENRKRMFEALEAFLARHIGQTRQPPPAAGSSAAR